MLTYREPSVTIDDISHKICPGCKKFVDLSMWTKANKDKRYGVSSRCKVCETTKRQQTRNQILAHYGNKCVCCGEPNVKFLALDHIHNNGAAHRKELGGRGGQLLLHWIKRNNYPKDVIQVLCHNCNMAKAFYGVCPHQESI
jgi:hypothetical protein